MSNHNLNSLPVSTSETQIEQIEPGFSSLSGKMLSGKTGQYAIHELIQNRPGVRTYAGEDLQTHAPVLIKEYHSFWWTISDIQQIELDLEQLEAIDFRSGGVQDFRLLIPQESIASWKDHRCYLVLKCPQHQPRSLRSHLETQGCLPPSAVRHLLSQVLQSLWFLHSLAIYLEDKDEVKKGIAHGNLSLDSLLITVDPSLPGQPSQFQVYLQDLQLWEAAIQHTKLSQIQSALKIQKQKDLQDLGKIAAQLLLGELDLPEAWNPDTDLRWQVIPDTPLKLFIQQLIGSETSTFSTAKAARTSLLSIPAEVESPPAPEQLDAPIEEQSNLEVVEETDILPLYFKIAYAIVFSALILNIGLLWVSGKFSQTPSFNNTETTK
jgi:hypothetical protein